MRGQEAKDLMPPGPYMDFEPDWDEIFITIAQCYAALSASNVVGNRVWEEDVRYGIELPVPSSFRSLPSSRWTWNV